MNKAFISLLFIILVNFGCSVGSESARNEDRIKIEHGQKLIEFEGYSILVDIDRDYPVVILSEGGNIIHGIDLIPGKSRVATHRYREDIVQIFFDTNGDGVLDGYHESEK